MKNYNELLRLITKDKLISITRTSSHRVEIRTESELNIWEYKIDYSAHLVASSVISKLGIEKLDLESVYLTSAGFSKFKVYLKENERIKY